jgi:hypothetical protein
MVVAAFLPVASHAVAVRQSGFKTQSRTVTSRGWAGLAAPALPLLLIREVVPEEF